MEITINVPDALVSKAKASGLSAETYVDLAPLGASQVDRDRQREQLREDLAADWEHFNATGLHLDGDEIDAWLARIADGHLDEPPALHI